jgi:hypothetical protein
MFNQVACTCVATCLWEGAHAAGLYSLPAVARCGVGHSYCDAAVQYMYWQAVWYDFGVLPAFDVRQYNLTLQGWHLCCTAMSPKYAAMEVFGRLLFHPLAGAVSDKLYCWLALQSHICNREQHFVPAVRHSRVTHAQSYAHLPRSTKEHGMRPAQIIHCACWIPNAITVSTHTHMVHSHQQLQHQARHIRSNTHHMAQHDSLTQAQQAAPIISIHPWPTRQHPA